MGDTCQLFSVYPRKRKKQKTVFYVRFRMPDGSRSAGKNSGELTRAAAMRWAWEYLKAGQVVEKEKVSVKGFSEGFFDWGGAWATDRKLSDGQISERVCLDNQATVINRIIPLLGKKNLKDLDRAEIKNFRRELFNKGYAPRSINKTLSCLKMVLEYAEEKKLIQGVPRIERAAGVGKKRGILNASEVKTLFQDGDFKDLRAKIANMTAAVTGIRAGELLGLQRKNVKPGYLEIHKSWNQMTRRLNESTKTGRGRDIPIPTIIQQALAGLMDQSPWQEPDDFVFTSTLRHAPMDGKVATHGLYEALESIGISEQMRKDRWIDFHSWRHWLNSTLINQRIPINKVMSITGHLTSEMTKNYYHPDDMLDVRRLQEKLFCMSQKKPG